MDIDHSLITFGRHDNQSIMTMVLTKVRFTDRCEKKRL